MLKSQPFDLCWRVLRLPPLPPSSALSHRPKCGSCFGTIASLLPSKVSGNSTFFPLSGTGSGDGEVQEELIKVLNWLRFGRGGGRGVRSEGSVKSLSKSLKARLAKHVRSNEPHASGWLHPVSAFSAPTTSSCTSPLPSRLIQPLLLDISIWVSSRSFKLNVPKPELRTFSYT